MSTAESKEKNKQNCNAKKEKNSHDKSCAIPVGHICLLSNK